MRELCSPAGELVYKYLSLALFLCLFPLLGHTQCVDGNLEGQVFLDEDVNGDFDNSESGISGILVTLYDSSGSSVATDFTNSLGEYQFTGLSNNDSYRVEVSYLQGYASSHMGQDHLSDTRYGTVPSCNMNFGLTNSSFGCGDNPEILLACFVRGDMSLYGTNPTIVGLDYQFNPASPTNYYATKAETGSIWGLAYDEENSKVYSAAFVKQYAALTPFGHDAIFITDTNFSTTQLFVKLSTLGINTGTLTTADSQDCDYGNQVGKIGLGNIVLSNDGGSLYVINMHDNTLVRIPVNNPTAANVQIFNIPDPQCVGGIARTFALESHNGKYYVGVTCDASLSRDGDDSSGTVYEFDPNDSSFTKIFQTNILKGFWDDTNPAGFFTSQWLSDIDFTDEGNMLLGLADRYGNRFCDGAYGRVDQQFPDLLIAWNNNGVWTLESNGVAGNLTGTGVNNGEGPDGGEFFGDDYFPGNKDYHNEVALGSFFALPGTGEVVAAVYDPLLNAYSGGLHRYNTSNGQISNAKELYVQNLSDQFGKATGFGEIVARCPRPKPEIGNYVWIDDDGDGLQGASEQIVTGVDVLLYDENCLEVGRTTTDAYGMYSFNNRNISNSGLVNPIFDGLLTNKQYYITLDPALCDPVTGSYSINANNYNVTFDDIDEKWGSDLVANTNVCSNVKHLIPASISSDEEVNHTYDIGLIKPSIFDLALMKTIDGNTSPKIGEDVTFNIDVYNQGDVIAAEIEITDYINPNFTFNPTKNPLWSLTGNKAKYKTNNSLLPNDYFRVQIVLTLKGSNVQNLLNYAEISNTVDQFGNTNTDVDSTTDDDPTNDNGAIINSSSDNDLDGDGTLDEDDHDVAFVEIMDIALRKQINESKPYYPGETATFNITVINQGNTDIDYFVINDYYPSTLTFLVAPSQNGWIEEAPGVLSFRDNGGLLVGQSKIIQVTFLVGQFPPTELQINTAEVVDARTDSGIDRDFDSDPDTDPTNDILLDNVIDDHGQIDEDDHDIASLSGLKIDLALTKTSEGNTFRIGDDVEFTITVYNQGDIPINNILLVDYCPAGLIINDANWDYDATTGNAYRTVVVPNGLQPGSNIGVALNATVAADATATTIDNYAEIMAATDMFGVDVAQYDCDSNPDGILDNDIGGRPDTDEDDEIMDTGERDEDDSDPARIFIIDFNVTVECRCLGNATTSSNGQFRDIMKVTAPSGQTWFIDYINGLYKNNSPNPPGLPVDFPTGPTGFTLIETVIGNGYSEYALGGVHVENLGYEVRVANEFGHFIQHINEGCSYEEAIITTNPGESLYSACSGSTRTYTAEVDEFCDVVWTLPDGSTSTDLEVSYTWGAIGGTILLDVDCRGVTCIQPRIMTVDLGGASGPIACIHDLNVSMDSDCAVLVTPQMVHAGTMDPNAAYGVMLLDANNNLVADNMITADHIGETLVVKLIDACSGNSCWANIFVEDKMPPSIQCGDITLPCYAMNTYMPLATDNCGSVAEVVLLSETIEPLSCDPDYVKRVTRSYQATDSNGNVSQPCSQTILVERFDFSLVVPPPSYTVIDGTALECADVIYGEDGTPDVEYAGIPMFWNEPLYPFPDYFCNVGIDYETLTISEEGCVRKYMRTWTVYEAHCGLGVVETYLQTIEIQDIDAPVVHCGDNLVLSTSGASCDRNVFLPPPSSIEDDCEGAFQVDIKYPGGFLNNVPNGGYAELPAGQHIITYVVYDACGNSSQCDMSVTITDDTSPTAICDQHTIVALRGDGTAEAYASTFDDGSYDDCGLHTLLVQRMNPPEDCPCDLPSFHDMDYLGELDEHYYYLSKTKMNSFKAFAYGQSMGGHPAIIETDYENTWIRSQVDGLLAGEEYYIGLSDASSEGTFVWNNGFPANYTNWNGGAPVNTADYVVANADGTWSVAADGREEAYVLEITDPCGWSDYVNFCCSDAGGEHMVALRAVDYFGQVTNCMAMVEVQDKIAPEITCPGPVTISCDEIINLDDLASRFGMATAIDGCQAEVIENAPLVDIDQCGVGQIKRTFVASDANGNVTCEQLITIENTDLFDVDRIVWPADYYSDESCNAGQLIPENLPVGHQAPVIDERFCDLVGAEYVDDIFFFSGDGSDACFKLLRTWTVIDWCTFDEDDSDLNNVSEATDDGFIAGYFRNQQTIKINNTVSPTITVTGPAEVCTYECENGYILLRATATDDCTPGENMVWQYQIDLDSDGIVDYPALSGVGNEIFADGTFPIGTHTILYTFEDRCGNMESELFSFTIKNCNTPTAACIDGLAVGLEAMDLDGDGTFDTEMGCIWSFAFDASSNHPCGYDIEVLFCDDPQDPSTYTTEKCFDCSDCGTQTVNICVVDVFGNVDFCTTSVEVQDNNNVDFCDNAGACVIPPVDEIIVTDCTVDYDPNVIGGFPTIAGDCFCDDFTMDYTDTFVEFPNDDCVGLLRTWEVTPNCGCISGNSTFAQTIVVMNQVDPTIDAPAGVIGFATDNCTAEVDLSLAIAFGQCNTGLLITNNFNAGGNDASGFYPVGSTPVTYTVTDDCGNTASDVTVVVVVDEQAPDCSALDVTLQLGANNSATVTVSQVSGGANDNCDGSNVDEFFLMVDGSTANSIDYDCGDIGANSVTLIVTDEAGNSTTCDAIVTVEDTILPTCSVQDITVSIDSGTSISIPASMIDTGSSDNCSDVVLSPASFDFDCSQLGTNTVVLTVTDAFGNTSTCSADITINEGVAPVCSIEPLVVNLTGDDIIITLDDIDYTASDACGEINTINFDNIMVNCGLLDGESTTTLSGDDGINIDFTDNFGNTTSCSANIILMDVSDIICSVQDITVNLGDAGQVFITPEEIDNGSSAGCDAELDLVLDITMLACNNLGDNTVTLTVTADNGSSSSCTATVTVVDDVPPSLLPNFCPPDMSILCDADISDLSVFGQPNMGGIMDNCPSSFSTSEEVVMNLNGCNIGIISRTFTLLDINGVVLLDVNGNPLTCTQIITVGGPANPITEADITWPNSPIDLNCSDPDINDMPIVDESGAECSSITITSDDVIVNPDNDCNFTIERTYTVTDACQLPGGVFTFTQIINITDTTPPSINVSPADITVDLTNEANTCSAIITLDYNVTDDCPESGDVVVTLDAPGLISQTEVNGNGGVSFDVEFCALDEDVTLTLTATDGCGNVSTDVLEVSMIGEGCLEFNCQKFIFAFDPSGETAIISNDYDVVDNACGSIDVDISYDNMDINDTIAVYDCQSIIDNGPPGTPNSNLNDFLYFYIDGELIDSCRIVVFFSNDPNGDGDLSDGWQEICGLTTLAGFVTGNVMTQALIPVEDVEVSLMGSPFEEVMTTNLGTYAFPIMDFGGGQYVIDPKKDGDYLNGVSTLDLIMIQKHILRTKEFDSPYSHIAADVNNSQSISGLDIIELRKLILGHKEAFGNNTSWRMVDQNFNFPDPNDPLNTEFPEQYFINSFDNDMNVGFIGVKIGDINNSATTGFTNSIVTETRSNNDLLINFSERNFVDGELFDIEFTINAEDGFEGTQFTINMDNDLLIIENVIVGDETLCKDNNINTNRIADGKVNLSWHGLEDFDGSTQTLIRITVQAKMSGSVSKALSLDEKGLTAESYFSNNVGDVILLPDTGLESENEIVLYQNSPNPWSESTNIKYYMSNAQEVTINVYDINGRLIKTNIQNAIKGVNELTINNAEIPSAGVLYYELITDNYKISKKMLLVK